MTVAQQTALYAYTGDSVTTDFPFPSKVLAAGDILVGVNGVLQTTGYSVLDVGVNVGSTVRFAAAPAAVRVVLLRKPPISQLVDFVNGQSTLDDTVENALDKLTMICQYLGFVLGRAVRLDDFDADDGSGLTLPPRAERISKSLGFDSNGELTATITSLTQADIDAIFAASVSAAQSAATAAAAAGATAVFETLAELNAAALGAGVNFVMLRERVAGSAAGGGVLRRTAAAHAWTTTSNAGSVRWEFMPPTVTPEQGGFTDVQAAVTAFNGLSATYSELYLDRRARTTATYPITWSAKVTGPGCDLVSHLGTEQRVGDELTTSQATNNPRRVLAAARRALNLSRPAELSAEIFTTAAQSVPNITYTAMSGTDYRDRCGAVEPSALGAFFVRAGWRRVRVSGRLTWDANSTGVRQAAIAVNGSVADSINIPPVAGGVTTGQVFDFTVDVVPGNQVAIQAWQNTGGSLNVLGYFARVDVVEYDIAAPKGERGLIFQGSWAAAEIAAGGYDGLALYLAGAKDTLILSGIETYNDDAGLFAQTPKKMWYDCVGPWAYSTAFSVGQRVHSQAENLMFICQVNHTSPASGTFAAYRAANPTHWRAAVVGDFPQVQSLGYARLRRLIRDYKRVNPDGEVWGYVSAASDAPYWDAAGNPRVGYRPLNMTLAGGSLDNVLFLVNQWVKSGLEIDGIFFDHAADTFIDATVLDNAISIVTAAGLPVAHNITFPSVNAVRFITKSGQARAGHMWVVEGAYRDGGVDTSAATNAMLAEVGKHRGRHIRLFYANEEPAPFFGNTVTPSSGCTYTQVGAAVTVTVRDGGGGAANHYLAVGDKVYVEPKAGTLASGVYTVTSITATTFAFTAGASGTNADQPVDVYCNRVSRVSMDTVGTNNLNGKSLFDLFKRPGDVYQYGPTSYDTLS